jgi:hypothetical protein
MFSVLVEVISYCNFWKTKRSKLDYHVDRKYHKHTKVS